MSAADPEDIAFSCPAQLLFDLANTQGCSTLYIETVKQHRSAI